MLQLARLQRKRNKTLRGHCNYSSFTYDETTLSVYNAIETIRKKLKDLLNLKIDQMCTRNTFLGIF